MCLQSSDLDITQLDVMHLQPDRETDLQCGGLTRVQMVDSGDWA